MAKRLKINRRHKIVLSVLNEKGRISINDDRVGKDIANELVLAGKARLDRGNLVPVAEMVTE